MNTTESVVVPERPVVAPERPERMQESHMTLDDAIYLRKALARMALLDEGVVGDARALIAPLAREAFRLQRVLNSARVTVFLPNSR